MKNANYTNEKRELSRIFLVVLSVVICVLLLSAAISVSAAEFAIVGPRPLGMGGAFVAVANDATAISWNPAGLALIGGKGAPWGAAAKPTNWEMVLPVGVRVLGANGTFDTIDAIRLYAPAAATAWLTELDKPGRGISGDAHMGGLFKFKNVGISALRVDALSIIPYVAGANTTIMLEDAALTEYGLSYGRKVGDSLMVGGTVKYIESETYSYDVGIWDAVAGADFEEWVDEATAKNSRTDSDFGVDLGILYSLGDKFRIGAVGKYLNSPEFDYYNDHTNTMGEIEIEPQLRAGFAFLPWDGLIVSADMDLTENETGIPGYDRQTLAAGVEWWVLHTLALRGGAYRNLAEDDIDMTFTAGIGLRFLWVQLNVGGAIDPDENEAGASAAWTVRF